MNHVSRELIREQERSVDALIADFDPKCDFVSVLPRGIRELLLAIRSDEDPVLEDLAMLVDAAAFQLEQGLASVHAGRGKLSRALALLELYRGSPLIDG